MYKLRPIGRYHYSVCPSMVLVSGNTKMAEKKFPGVHATWEWHWVLWKLSKQLIAKKVLIPLGNTKRELGNAWRGGEHLLSSWMLNWRKLSCERSGGCSTCIVYVKPYSQGLLIAARAYPGFCNMKRLEIFLLPLDGMLVHPRSLPHNLLGSPNNSPVPIYTPGWREALWE